MDRFVERHFFSILLALVLGIVAIVWSLPSKAGGLLDLMSSADGVAVCSGADVATTIAAVQRGAVEANPLWSRSVNQHHYAPMIIGNLAITGLAYGFESSIDKNAFLAFNLLRCGIAGANLRFVF